MAHRFNVFSGLDRHINKKNKSIPVNHEPDNNRITPEQIKDIVSREVNAASTRSQMMNYFDSIAAAASVPRLCLWNCGMRLMPDLHP